MQHVSDGELHAYLDGALDILPGERGEEVRSHLSSCSACRERLEDEESARSRAQEILGSATLDELSLPSFEELKGLVEAGDGGDSGLVGRGTGKGSPLRHRGPLRGLPLAWVATVVLALGVGWMGGQIWPSMEDATFSTAERGATAQDADDDRIPVIEEELSPEIRYAELEKPAAPISGSSRSQVRGERMSLDGSGLTVPGLRVLSVEWEEWAPGERALHIRQLLSPGDTLELRYLGMLIGTEPNRERSGAGKAEDSAPSFDVPLSPSGLEASLPPGWNQVEMMWGKGWLVARAPLPEASIRALLKTLR